MLSYFVAAPFSCLFFFFLPYVSTYNFHIKLDILLRSVEYPFHSWIFKIVIVFVSDIKCIYITYTYVCYFSIIVLFPGLRFLLVSITICQSSDSDSLFSKLYSKESVLKSGKRANISKQQ